MVCNKCGKFNEEGQNFCRFCGANLTAKKTPTTYAPPRPHGWASPSSPLHDVSGGGLPQVQPLAPPNPPPALAHPHAALGYRCPHCGTTAPPQITKKISTGGWIVFAVMLLVCFPLFWLGFFIKEENRVCSMCMTKLG